MADKKKEAPKKEVKVDKPKTNELGEPYIKEETVVKK